VASLEKRGSVWFVQWYEGEKQRRRSLETDSLQVAKWRTPVRHSLNPGRLTVPGLARFI
jgi:hypothetical protein